ncbi:hypothetical protein DEU56DRAFT_761187 [Suillus clintonianus]|uniref:uncharacterized protein n=1 Tax=Suillus clintonianus TaxID=1904413 RepID=UPI001B885374|nr:uncharacterized protein DEU56DRAFT_761187 [Suillus clintonianus]KAG2118492.1 hypothetical protein DEU56DRAFT_761187 [Suillus clintonianus]
MATQIALRAKIMVTSIRDESHMKGGNQDLATQIAPRANKKVKRRDQDLATQIPLRAKIMVTSIRDESHMKGVNQDLATQIAPRANKKVKRIYTSRGVLVVSSLRDATEANLFNYEEDQGLARHRIYAKTCKNCDGVMKKEVQEVKARKGGSQHSSESFG